MAEIIKARVLVIGGSGFIGARFAQLAIAAGHPVAYTYATRPVALQATAYQVRLDEATAALAHSISDFQPQIVVYAAVPPFVYSSGSTIHHQVSVEGVRQTLAELSRVAPATRFIYLSTNTVFGSGSGLNRESDPPDPQVRNDPYLTYAVTKAAGEQVALDSWPDTLVARTSVVYGRNLNGLLYPRVAAMVESLQAGKPLVRFRDRYISPTLVDNLAEAMLEIIQPGFTYRGILHLAGSARVTDHDYGLALARRLGVAESLVQSESMADVAAMAHSPRDNSLDVSFTQSLLQTRLLGLEAQLDHLLL